MLLASASRVVAQHPCTPDFLSSLPSGDVAWCAAEKAPALVAPAKIRYPDLLRSANYSGDALIEATIDTSGRVDLTTMKVRRETHQLFINAVRASMAAWRFVPARTAGSPVRARGVFHVEFLLPHDSIPRDSIVEPPHATLTGLDFAVGWRTTPYDPPATVDTMQFYDLIAAIARAHAASDTTRELCLAWQQSARQSEPPAALIDYLRDHGAPRLPPSRCPPTYAIMVLRLDSLGRPVGRPPGTVDPQLLTISELRPWSKDLFVFRYSVWIGTGGNSAPCQTSWNASRGEWQISCGAVTHSVS